MQKMVFSGQRIPRELIVLPTEEYYRRRYRSHGRRGWWLVLVTLIAVGVAAAGARAAHTKEGGSVPRKSFIGLEVFVKETGRGGLPFVTGTQGCLQPALYLDRKARASMLAKRGSVPRNFSSGSAATAGGTLAYEFYANDTADRARFQL